MRVGRTILLLGACMALLVPGPASADHRVVTMSHSGPCRFLACDFPFHASRTVELEPGSNAVGPYCVAEVAGVCSFGLQGDELLPPSLGIPIIVNSTSPATRLDVVVCNNISDTVFLERHCPLSTRITVRITFHDESGAGVSLAQICLRFLGDIPTFTTCLGPTTFE